MKKNDIKISLERISPDPYLETRLSAKVEAHRPETKKKNNKLVISTAIICCLLIVAGTGVGIGLFNTPLNTTTVSHTNHYASETASVDFAEASKEVLEALNTTKESYETTNGTCFSVPAIETEVHHNQVLLVNGKDIAPENYVKFYEMKNYALLPFNAILKEFGAETIWQSETTAIISFKGKNYTLDTEACTLVAEGNTTNLLKPAVSSGEKLPGDIPMYMIYADEFIVDNYIMQGALNALNINCVISVNYKSETVTIS